MTRVFGSISTEYLDRFQPSVWTDFNRVFGFFTAQLAVTNPLFLVQRHFLTFRLKARSAVIAVIHFLEIILLLPVPETSRSVRIDRVRLVSASFFLLFTVFRCCASSLYVGTFCKLV